MLRGRLCRSIRLRASPLLLLPPLRRRRSGGEEEVAAEELAEVVLGVLDRVGLGCSEVVLAEFDRARTLQAVLRWVGQLHFAI